MLALPGRIGLIGDVHQEDEGLQTALRHLADVGVSGVLCTGDIVDGFGNVWRCMDLLREAGAHLVRGNHDRWLVQNVMRNMPDALEPEALTQADRAWLGGLPATLRFDTELGSLLLCHGLGKNDMGSVTPDDFGYALEVNDDLQALMRESKVEIVVAGHTHRRMVRRFGDLVVINAGTLLRTHDPGFAVADFESRTVRFFDLAGAGIRAVPPVSLAGA